MALKAAENEYAAGELQAAVDRAAVLADKSARNLNFFIQLNARCLTVECELERENLSRALEVLEYANQQLLAHVPLQRRVRFSTDRLVRDMFGRRGPAHIALWKVEILGRRAEPEQADTESWEPEAFALAMGIARAVDSVVELNVAEARQAAKAGKLELSQRSCARALMELDRGRYRLTAQSSRTSWSRRFHRVLELSLDIAHQAKDHEFVAELLEFARVQTVPAASAESLDDLALEMPPVILVNGRTRLARPDTLRRPPHVRLEEAAQRATGSPKAWWLAYWDTGEWLYWALISPSGDVVSGRISSGPRSKLRSELRALERALPVLLDGENNAERDFRLHGSVLLNDPAGERALSTALGMLLLPSNLVQAALSCESSCTRLPLAIAPAASLGYVPWSILVASLDSPNSLRSDPNSLRSDRLIDLCDWVLAPSAALIARATVETVAPAPLKLAVADTVDVADPKIGLRMLNGARMQSLTLPASVKVLGGAHWSRDIANLGRLEEELKAAGPHSSVAFFCHAIRGSTDEPSSGGLVMAASPDGSSRPVGAATQYEVLTPRLLFDMKRRGLGMPAQVLLQACDTSALNDTTSGEWLTIAPALIAAGSREVVTTSYPVLDLPEMDPRLMTAAIEGTSLKTAVAELQREGLKRWVLDQNVEPARTPLTWAPFCTIAVHGSGEWSQPHRAGTTLSYSCVRVVAEAIEAARESRAKRLDSGYLLNPVLDIDGIADYLDGGSGGSIWNPATWVWELGPLVLTRWGPFHDKGPSASLGGVGSALSVPLVVLDAIKSAGQAARHDGVPLSPYHIIESLFNSTAAVRNLLPLLSRLGRSRPEVVRRALESTFLDEVSRRSSFYDTSGAIDDRHELAVELLLMAAP